MKLEADLPLPFPADEQEKLLMAAMTDAGTVASEGTDRYELLCILVDRGLVSKHYAEGIAGGIHCFQPTAAGLEALLTQA